MFGSWVSPIGLSESVRVLLGESSLLSDGRVGESVAAASDPTICCSLDEIATIVISTRCSFIRISDLCFSGCPLTRRRLWLAMTLHRYLFFSDKQVLCSWKNACFGGPKPDLGSVSQAKYGPLFRKTALWILTTLLTQMRAFFVPPPQLTWEPNESIRVQVQYRTLSRTVRVYRTESWE